MVLVIGLWTFVRVSLAKTASDSLDDETCSCDRPNTPADLWAVRGSFSRHPRALCVDDAHARDRRILTLHQARQGAQVVARRTRQLTRWRHPSSAIASEEPPWFQRIFP